MNHYEQLCRSLKKKQHIQRNSSTAEEDNWDNKIQKINSNDQKVFYNTTLLVNQRPIKFIDSGSPVTLIPNSLFNQTTEVEPLVTTYREEKNQRIEYSGQTKAVVKTNKTTELPLLIPKATTSPLMGLDWMQRLGIQVNADNSEIQILKNKMDDTEKKIVQLKNGFKDLFYDNKEIKDLPVKIIIKEESQITQTKRKANTNTLTRTSGKRTTTIDRERISGKSNRNNSRFCEPRRHNRKGQINQNNTRFKKNERSNNKTESTNAKHGRTNSKKFKNNIRRRR